MTKHERMIISAYTGVLVAKNFDEFHEWVEQYLGIPVWSHEFALQEFWDNLKQKVEPEFMAIVEQSDRC